MLKTDGGLLRLWRQIVRKRCSIQKKKKKKPCKNGIFGRENEKWEMIKERWKNWVNKR